MLATATATCGDRLRTSSGRAVRVMSYKPTYQECITKFITTYW